MGFRIRLFGPVSVTVEDRVLGPSDFGGTKPKHLLEILLLARGLHISKYRLMEALWGDRPPTGALGALETHVSLLRTRLGLPRPGLIVSDSETYAANIPEGTLDLDEFDQSLQRAVWGPREEAMGHLARALELGHQTVLEDEPYAEWVIAVRERYMRLCHDAAVMAAELALAAGRSAEALMYSNIAIGRDPFSERAVRLRMRASYTLGRQHEAIFVFKGLRKLLRSELRVPPMDETTALYGAIRRHDVGAREPFIDPSPAVAVPPVGQAIGGTRLSDDLDWLAAGRASNGPGHR